MPPARRKRILILGGGFAGLAAALRLSTAYRVTLVDRSRWFEFLPNIHELVSGVKSTRLLRLPIDRIVRRAGHSFRRDSVTSIDTEAQIVATSKGEPLSYDVLIVALGGVNATRGVVGVDENAYAFKSVEDCARIGRRLSELAAAGGVHDAVIVGGGLEGIEALGEILRRYRQRGSFRVTLVEARERLLPEAPESLDAAVRELSAAWDVRFETGARIERVERDAVVLDGGARLPSSVTIWTGGPAASPLLAASGLAPRTGDWAPVEQSLLSTRSPRVLVAGDAAHLPTPLSKQGYHALDMGECAACNAERLLEERRLRPFRPSEKPMLISFGDLTCFLVAGDHAVAAPSMALAKEGIFEWVMSRLDRAPLWETLPRVAARVSRASRRVVWPSVSSLGSLRRQARVSVLG
jgi:NADH dehydrogenase